MHGLIALLIVARSVLLIAADRDFLRKLMSHLVSWRRAKDYAPPAPAPRLGAIELESGRRFAGANGPPAEPVSARAADDHVTGRVPLSLAAAFKYG